MPTAAPSVMQPSRPQRWREGARPSRGLRSAAGAQAKRLEHGHDSSVGTATRLAFLFVLAVAAGCADDGTASTKPSESDADASCDSAGPACASDEPRDAGTPDVGPDAAVDECTGGTHDCDAHATCSDTATGYECTCDPGYAGDGTSCADVDECADGTDDCDAHASCTNTEGGYECACDAGYTGDGTSCTDVDECADGADDCDAHASCTNTEGGYECACDAGYTGDGTRCADVNECAADTDDCGANATCSNTEGSFECTCNDDYVGDGRQCDFDECAAGADDCDANATCSNTQGGFECACNDGYVGDGESCADVDECLEGTHDCDVNAACANTVGAYECTCNDGYVGDGAICDFDECAAGLDDCGPEAECVNTPGSFRCACVYGLTGDGYTCTSVDEVIAGHLTSCAILSDGRTKCWGYVNTDSFGDEPGEMGDALLPTDFGPGRTAVSVSMGGWLYAIPHWVGCAVLDDGSVKCWGDNTWGELGIGDSVIRSDGPATYPPIDLGTGRIATEVVVGGHGVTTTLGATHTCVLLSDGAVKCWGANDGGQLGLGDTQRRGDQPGEMGDNLPPLDLGTDRTVIALDAGAGHTCALLDDGNMKCWGKNAHGQLGLGDSASRGALAGQMGDDLPAVDLGSGRAAVAIAVSGHHSCALLDDGSVKCWGDNFWAQLGQGTATTPIGAAAGEMGDALPPVRLGTGRHATALCAGAMHVCAVLDGGDLKCWGRNDRGALGLGDANDRGARSSDMGDNLPIVNLGTDRTVAQVSCGEAHTCALLDDGNVKCWGMGSAGYGIGGFLGRGDYEIVGTRPGDMGNALRPVAIVGVGP